MIKTYNIMTTKLGQECGLALIETVILSDLNTDGANLTPCGALVFEVGGEQIIYAPGTWGIVTTETGD